MNIVSSVALAKLLEPMLRLPANTTRFVIRAEAGKPAVIEIECMLPEPLGVDGEFGKQLKEYQLVHTSAPKKFDFDVWMAERREKAHREFMEAGKRFRRIDNHIEVLKIFEESVSYSFSH